MKPLKYLKDKWEVIITTTMSVFIGSIILYLLGNQFYIILILDVFIIIIVSLNVIKEYIRRNKYWTEIQFILEGLDQKYLITEIMEKPLLYEESLYFELMRCCMKSMIEDVSKEKKGNLEYREYIEHWVHEIKIPITGIKLICENDKSENHKRIMSQLELIESVVEKVLYFARMSSVEKDYIIREVDLKEVVRNVLISNKQILMYNNVMVDIESLNAVVNSDSKWIEFIIKQIISNSIKYRSDREPHIIIESVSYNQRVLLRIKDNGIGIRESEIKRIFEKGFTGTNGRKNNNSTGMGLYLCKELCQKLGVSLEVESIRNLHTTICLSFPQNSSIKL